MAWLDAVDGYCERLKPGYWAEPVNAVTNLAFVVAAAVMWRRTAGLPLARAMVLVLAAIGVGSYLFHTHANRVTGVMDVIPIVAFILLYVFAASRDFLRLTPWRAGLATVAFLPYAAATVPLWSMVPGLGSSAGYAPVPVLILVYAWLLRRRAPATAQGLAAGAGLLVLSLVFRTVDEPLCGVWPMGTHFLWHLLNAVMLGWMINVYVRHRTGRA
ncbi:MAG: ceramidase domain-containing protein [Rhodobacter sp.]|nr:ceramidase domain-containing protein [Rhodobacter sp.]MCA3515235.1 ceramidase domain-containing protein [Rhodobacter sp.]MCA3519502.1 ceramidase domain-containing protein [Rhodobacter sp.]MCA3524247.1 ceramidase domain-containing protein [Rhodobacter sp.]MCA3526392.1 ceramidase domain-containing protein [Rhodobacter sp.]